MFWFHDRINFHWILSKYTWVNFWANFDFHSNVIIHVENILKIIRTFQFIKIFQIYNNGNYYYKLLLLLLSCFITFSQFESVRSTENRWTSEWQLVVNVNELRVDRSRWLSQIIVAFFAYIIDSLLNLWIHMNILA